MYVFAQKLPNWLFCFNKATILCTKNFIFPEKFNPDVKVTIASYSDIDEINRISGVQSIHIKEMMDSGAKCFMASIKDEPPSSVTWSANRKTYVRGLAFLHDIGTNGYYSFGSITLPNARGKGIYLKAKCEKIKYEMSKGAEKFYGTIEFTNTYSYSLQEKLGYQPTIKLTYVKMLFMKICIVKDISTGKFSIRIIVREPKGNIIII
ncbi:MAG: hypothetical protein GY865_17525 [candidate division Zixibacteria bacterium]|nr:hypothetical protein [candidate division Zixibacteria bacterium]